MPTYKTKIPDRNGSSQQNVFVSKQWKKQGWLYSYKFIFSPNFSSDTGQNEILPNCRCQASVLVATVSGHIKLTHCSYEILRRFKRLQCLCPYPLMYDAKKNKKKTPVFYRIWSHFTMPFLPYLIVHSVHWDGGLLSPLVAWIADFCQSSSQDNFNDRQHNDDAKYSKCLIFLLSVLHLDIFLYKPPFVVEKVVWVLTSNSKKRQWFDTPVLIPQRCDSSVDNTRHANRPNSMDLKKLKSINYKVYWRGWLSYVNQKDKLHFWIGIHQEPITWSVQLSY